MEITGLVTQLVGVVFYPTLLISETPTPSSFQLTTKPPGAPSERMVLRALVALVSSYLSRSEAEEVGELDEELPAVVV